MSREWKPGDVAALTIAGEQVVGVVQAEKSTGALLWQIGGHSFYLSIAVGNAVLIQDARPLVVIDPEDREQVERLTKALADATPKIVVGLDLGDREAMDRHYVNATQAALREFADPKPPKPDEPTGLGAVVEDDKGRPWIRWSNGRGCVWRCPDTVAFDGRAYGSISAVRVLSEGVQL